jgi:predicted RNA-binding Zn ribbon-like protein
MVIMTATLNGVTPPSWASHVEDKLAPMPLLRVQAFVDTLDQDLGTDVFAHPDEARAWLADAGLRPADPDGPGPGFADDLRLAREAREAIRTLIGRGAEDEPLTPGDLAPLEEILGRSQPRLDVAVDGRVRLGPTLPTDTTTTDTTTTDTTTADTLAADTLADGTLADGLLALLLIIRDAQADGSWDRLKLCANPDCRWAFYDRTHSRRGAWCDMASCGNRLKNRNLRARRAQLS